MEPVKVTIHNHEYFIKSECAAEEIRKIAEFINAKLNEVEEKSQGLSEKKMLILAAMNIASEYLQFLKDRDEMLANIRQRTEMLIYHIDSVIG